MLTQIHAAVHGSTKTLQAESSVVQSDVRRVEDCIRGVGNQIIDINEKVEAVKQGITSMNSQLMEIASRYQSDYLCHSL